MKTKRKLKGMTLMEVVVSLAVYAVIGLLIAEIMTLVNATMKATNQLNRRLSYEAKFADNLLYSDGVGSFQRNDVTLTMHDASGAFNITAPGSVFQTNADNMEHTENNLIINENTNYRFLVFTRGAASVPTPITVFYVDLNLGNASDIAANPITKIIIEGSGVPGYSGAYAFGTESGPIYEKQILTDNHPADSDVTGTSPIAINYPGMESIASGSRILRIAVPAADAHGNAILPDPTDPNAADDPVKGNLIVRIFRGIQDQSGSKMYDWFEGEDVTFISRNFTNPQGLVLDAYGFPPSATLTLDFVLSAVNPNTDERSFFSGVTYVWNPNLDPSNPNYLVAQEAVGTR